IPNEVGSYLAWTVENLEGSKFNSFALHTSEDVESLGFSVYGRYESVDESTSMLFMTEAFLMQEDTPLPEGFTLNAEMGEITGKATAEMEVADLVVQEPEGC
ncbi:hypothetical protein WA556_005376, partial [Blastocystis sp. ATCC 50177/Nand II]